MRTFLRLIAIPLLALFILLFPISLMMRNIGQLVFDPQTTQGLIKDQFLEGDQLSIAIQQMARSLLQAQTGDSEDLAPVIEKGFAALDDQDWVAITDLITPRNLILDTSEDVVSALVAWLDSEEAVPQLSIQLQPWKDNIEQSGEEIVRIVLNALPDCTLEEMGSQILDGLSGEEGLSAAIPACKPAEPLYSTFVENSGGFVRSFIERMPEQINLSELPIQGLDELARVKEILQQARFILSWSWVLVLGVGLLSVGMAAKDWDGAMRWAGWPALLAGVGTVLLAGSLGLASGDLLLRLAANFLQGGPTEAASLMQALLGGIGIGLAQPLYWQGGVTLGLGLLLLVGARYLGAEAKEIT